MLPHWQTTRVHRSFNFDGMGRIRKGARVHLYVREWVEHRRVSVERLAGRLGVDRSAIYKWINGDRRLKAEDIASIADALDIKPQDLWRPPSRPSIDALLEGQPDSVVAKAAEMIEILKRAG
jgi:transcriptional regulator with XRE-family HTH domain